MNILIVDDDPEIVEMLKEIVEDEFPRDIRISIANNGEEATHQLIKEGDIDVVLLDFNMPGVNGLNLIHNLENSSRFDKFPTVILITGYPDIEIPVELKKFQTFVLAKPVDEQKLIYKLKLIQNKVLKDLENAG